MTYRDLLAHAAGSNDRFTWDDARRALRAGCEAANLDATEAKAVRLGENAIFRLQSRPVVARIARDLAFLPDVRKEVAVSRWLETVGFPALQLVSDLTQPLSVTSRVITWWVAIGDGATHGTVADLASLLRALHRMSIPVDVGLPEFKPLRRSRRRLGNPALADSDRSFLRHRVHELETQLETLSFALPKGPVHGDADVSNVLIDDDGQAVLIDFESFCVGPPEWDLVLTAMGTDGYGWSTPEDHARFVEVYGFDVRQWEGYEVLRATQELMTVLWISQNIGQDPKIDAEFQRRMHTLRTGEGRELWTAF